GLRAAVASGRLICAFLGGFVPCEPLFPGSLVIGDGAVAGACWQADRQRNCYGNGRNDRTRHSAKPPVSSADLVPPFDPWAARGTPPSLGRRGGDSSGFGGQFRGREARGPDLPLHSFCLLL